jgi:photosystem II stability/assembly factor-like uncharacterized protein
MKHLLVALSISAVLFSCFNKKESIPEKPLGWEIFQTPIKSSLRGLSPVTQDIVWACGSNGVWLRSLDGGKTWDHGVIAGMDSVDFRSIYGFDAENAIVVSAGQPAVIYLTSDGGKSWALKHQESEKAFLNGISFANQENGYIIGDPVDGKWMILKTTNKGESWYAMLNPPDAVLGEAGFAASSSSIFADEDLLVLGSGGSEANLYISTNAGDRWEKYKSPLVQGKSTRGIFAITQMGGSEIVVVGGDYSLESDPTGSFGIFLLNLKDWAKQLGLPKGYRSGISFYSKFGWLVGVGPSGTDFSKDGGLIWENFSLEGFHSVKAGHTEASIWAFGSNGKIAKLKY